MKEIFKAVGKAVLYFGVYLLVQVIVSMIFSISISTKLTMEMMATGEELDVMALTEQVTAAVMDQAMLMIYFRHCSITDLLGYFPDSQKKADGRSNDTSDSYKRNFTDYITGGHFQCDYIGIDWTHSMATELDGFLYDEFLCY